MSFIFGQEAGSIRFDRFNELHSYGTVVTMYLRMLWDPREIMPLHHSSYKIKTAAYQSFTLIDSIAIIFCTLNYFKRENS